MALTLRQKQSIFALKVAELIEEAYERGYEITIGHVYRTKEEAKRLGFEHSLHCDKLAIDLNLFKDGRYLRKTSDHLELGEYWESLSTADFICHWGGRFGDGNHYSIGHGKRK